MLLKYVGIYLSSQWDIIYINTLVYWNANVSQQQLWGGYILTVPFWMMREAPLFYRWVNLGGVFSYGYRYFVEFAGAYTFYILGKQFLNIHIPFINYLGTKTLGIYAFQFIVLYHFALKCDTYFCILITTIICIFLSLILVEVVHRIKYIRLFLIGER